MSVSLNVNTTLDTDENPGALSARLHTSESGYQAVWIGGAGSGWHIGLSVDDARTLSMALADAVLAAEAQTGMRLVQEPIALDT